jgi:hypothetical protein
MEKCLGFFKTNLLLLIGIFVFDSGFAQEFQTTFIPSQLTPSSVSPPIEKCAQPILLEKRQTEMGYFGSTSFFESWIDKKIILSNQEPKSFLKLNEGPRLIPVVVHIIHSGQIEGEGVNVLESQIYEQIRVLNEDFSRQNQDAVNTPAEFLPVAGSSNIQFILAKQDPNGLPTNGIDRIQGTKNNYNQDDAALLGQIAQWDPNEYLNLYVVQLSNPLIGYASFPLSDLPGLGFPATSSISDGVTIDYRFFGIGGNAAEISRGRTATHEIGHYLGLRHIWGDGGCGVDDFVTDTPTQDNSNSVCNANPSRFSCNSNDMIQNYMDYTPDRCMNIFTKGQIERFDVVLANSPRRMTLVNNRATKDPQLVSIDLAISKIIEPGDFACDPIVSPKVELINAGKNNLTSGVVEMNLNGSLLESKFFTFDLASGESITVNFKNFNLTEISNTLEFKVTQANGVEDENAKNNLKLITPALQQVVSLPIVADLSQYPFPWTIKNPDESLTWEKINLTISGKAQDVVRIRNYEYEAPGQYDYLISPIINLSQYPNAQLVFEMAHATYAQQGFQDNLYVALSADCGNTFDFANAPYKKSGQSLQTSEASVDEFIPTEDSLFRTEIVNLNKFKDLGEVRLAIITENAYGNNIYLRNIRVLSNEEFDYGLTLDTIIKPNPISPGDHPKEVIGLTNTGNLPISTFVFSRSTNDNDPVSFLANGADVAPGQRFSVSSDPSTGIGENKLKFEVSLPNFDQNDGNTNSITNYILHDSTRISVPWRENFNSSQGLNSWKTINPEKNAEAWRTTPLSIGEGTNNAAALSNPITGSSYWLASPIFDLSSRSQASVFFDLAGSNPSATTRLKMFVSENGGNDYVEIWSKSGDELETIVSGTPEDNLNNFTRMYVNLSDYAGAGKTKTRIAFVLEGALPESKIYLDNIELFLSATKDPVIPAVNMTVLYPNPTNDLFNLAFNLTSYEDVTIQVISSAGALVQEIIYPGTLNQTYTFSTQLFSKGVFIIKISSNTISDTRRLIIN